MKVKNIFIYLSLFMATIISGCSDFLDINDDPNSPLTVPMRQMLPAAQLSMARGTGPQGGGLSQYTSLYMHQLVQRGIAANDYAFDGQTGGVATPWANLYINSLTNIREILAKAEVENAPQYAGIAKIMKAYIFSVLVDIYGDAPYFNSNLGSANTDPVYDKGEDIYDDLFLLIDEAIEDLNQPAAILMPGTDDLIYRGDLQNWVRFGNTLKLKMYTQIRNVRNVSAAVQDLIANQPLIEGQGQDFQIAYGTTTAPDSRNPLFAAEWAPSGSGYNISPYFYEIMRGINTYGHGNEVFLGIPDPRINYYFYNQLGPSEAPQNATSYFDVTTRFLSIHMFSFNIDPNEGFDQGASRTVVGLYPAGGRFNVGDGQNANFPLGTGSAPHRMLTFYARKYLEAELALEGLIPGDPAVLLADAINASFAKVNQVVTTSAATGTPQISAAAINTYRNDVIARFNAGNNDVKLEIIMTQKWIASFGYAVDAYTDYRRTGYPRLFDGNTDNLATTIRTREFPTAFPWSLNDLQINRNAPAQKNITVYRVFWNN